jgi:anti-sigma factor RsiW
MSDIQQIQRALSERLGEVGAQLEALEDERDRLRRALRALRDEVAPQNACPDRGRAALPHAPPWQPDRLRR